jgi:polysaccharide biosynthesis protein PslA
VILISIVSLLVANHSAVQYFVANYPPIISRLPPETMSGDRLIWALTLTVVVFAFSMLPLFKNRQRRSIDTVTLSIERIAMGIVILAAIGYFKWSIRLPRSTLIALGGLLVVLLPLWLLFTGTRPTSERALIVGANPFEIERAASSIPHDIVGYLSPQAAVRVRSTVRTDGGSVLGKSLPAHGEIDWVGTDIDRLGGISRLEEILIEQNIDTVIIAFGETDRGEFFGALETCRELGVRAIVDETHADSVLVAGGYTDGFVEVAIEPWAWWDHLGKRALDIVFSSVALLALSPMMVLIAIAIKLDSPGSVLYAQFRTAGFGRTFPVYKFRTMVPESESTIPIDDEENDRITGVGRVLRKSNLDEIPQLWSIFAGEMSVVGPRATWVEEEEQILADVAGWRKRWFVKPGLTGLAQVNEVTSTEPECKLTYDIEYIQRQSLSYDIRLILRQFLNVGRDVAELLVGDEGPDGSRASPRND